MRFLKVKTHYTHRSHNTFKKFKIKLIIIDASENEKDS